MIGLASVLRIARKARLRFDQRSGEHILLYPERGLVLSTSAADVVTLLNGGRPVASVVDVLAEKYGNADREMIARDVVELLQGLAERGLVEEVDR